MFHGNGGNVGHRIPLAAIFYKRMRCNVFMMSYRGYITFALKRLHSILILKICSYGLSEGSPSEQGSILRSRTLPLSFRDF